MNQAGNLSPDDALVENERAYLLFRKAVLSPGASDAPKLVEQAVSSLEDLIESRGTTDPYPFHVLGSQGLAWSRRGIPNRDERAKFLRYLEKQVAQGSKRHPSAKDLLELRGDLQKELLGLAAH